MLPALRSHIAWKDERPAVIFVSISASLWFPKTKCAVCSVQVSNQHDTSVKILLRGGRTSAGIAVTGPGFTEAIVIIRSGKGFLTVYAHLIFHPHCTRLATAALARMVAFAEGKCCKQQKWAVVHSARRSARTTTKQQLARILLGQPWPLVNKSHHIVNTSLHHLPWFVSSVLPPRNNMNLKHRFKILFPKCQIK